MGLSYPVAKERDSVEIQRNVESLSATYSRVPRWETIATVRAWVEQLRGSQAFYNDHLGHSTTHKVHMRYRGDIDTTMQLRWDTRVLSIIYVWPGSPPYYELEIMCDEVFEVP